MGFLQMFAFSNCRNIGYSKRVWVSAFFLPWGKTRPIFLVCCGKIQEKSAACFEQFAWIVVLRLIENKKFQCQSVYNLDESINFWHFLFSGKFILDWKLVTTTSYFYQPIFKFQSLANISSQFFCFLHHRYSKPNPRDIL